MIPDLAGRVIEIVRLNYALQMWTEDNWEIDLTGQITLSEVRTGANGVPEATDQIVFDLGSYSELPASLARLEGARIQQMLVAQEGHLALVFDGWQVFVPARPTGEAWEISGADGEMLICMPGGELAYFPPTPGAARPDPADARDT